MANSAAHEMTLNSAKRRRTMRGSAAWVCAALLVWAIAAPDLRADALDGALDVRSAYINVDKGVYQLFAKVIYPDSDAIRAALKDGVTLEFDLDVVVSRERRYWFDGDVAQFTLRRELSYNTVSERFLMRDAPDGEQSSFASLEAALDALGNVEAWPILVQPQVVSRGRYRVAVRAGIRRGSLADSLRTLLFWTDDWHRESEWYSWSLPQ
jgi:Domain of unknown function (DUF4390)